MLNVKNVINILDYKFIKMKKEFTKKMIYKTIYYNNVSYIVYCKTQKDKLEELEKYWEEYTDNLIEEFWGIDNFDEAYEKYIDEKFYNFDVNELKEFLEWVYSFFKKHVSEEWCIKMIIAMFIRDWILDEYEAKEIKEKIKKDKEFQKYLFKIMLEWLDNITKVNRYSFSRWMEELYKLIWEKLPKIWGIDYYNLSEFEFYDYWEKYVDDYLRKKGIEWVMKEVFE